LRKWQTLDGIEEILSKAEILSRRIPPEQYDFMAAKADVMRHTTL
jgi:hypothetical protein